MKKIMVCAILALSIVLPARSHAQFVQNTPFNFQVSGQNMWGGSGQSSWEWSKFLGLDWNESLSIGGIAGSAQDCLDLGWLGSICTDTRTGFLITGSTYGQIGLNVGASVSAGTVDVTVPGQGTVSVASPFQTPGQVFTVGSGYTIDPSANIHTQFPSFSLFADLVIDAHADVQSKECFIGLGCDTQGPASLINVSTTPELASFNRDNNGQLKVFGLEVPLEGSYGPVSFKASIPNLETDASAASNSLSSSGEAEVLRMGMDIPSVIADLIYPGAGYAFTGSIYGITYTTLGASLEPNFSIGQDFTFKSTPMVTLDFSEPVSRVVTGFEQDCSWIICVPKEVTDTLAPASSWDVALGMGADFVFPEALTLDVTPTYWLNNSLEVSTDLLSRLDLIVTALSLSTPLGGIGPAFSLPFQTDPVAINLDDRTYSMDFGTYQGSAFELTATPEPSTWVLLGSGLLLLGLAGWYKQHLA